MPNLIAEVEREFTDMAGLLLISVKDVPTRAGEGECR